MNEAENERPGWKRRTLNRMANNRLLQKIRAAIPKSWADAIIRILRRTAAPTGKLEEGNINGVKVIVPDDAHWGRYCRDLSGYEPEVKAIIDKFFDKETLFIDCGANIGSWSSYAAAKIGDGSKVVAVEPGEETRSALLKNQELHGFIVDHSAIYNVPNIPLTFYVNENHVASSLVADSSKETPVRSINVTTNTLDNIVQKHRKNENIIIKLDVERVEKEAMQGAANLIASKQNAMFIYEDHGSDRTSETTNFMLNDMKMHVYTVTKGKTLSAKRVMEAKELESIKTCPGTGYNFVACIPGTSFDQEMNNLCTQIPSPAQRIATEKYKSGNESPQAQRRSERR